MSSSSARSVEGRALDLILAIDRIRDTAVDERAMAAEIVRILAEAVQAELCVLCLTDDETGELDLHTLADGLGALDDPGAEQPLRELAQKAASAPTAQFVTTDVTLGGRRHGYCIAGPLRVGGDSLGALLLLNEDRPFDAGEIELVSRFGDAVRIVAASQTEPFRVVGGPAR